MTTGWAASKQSFFGGGPSCWLAGSGTSRDAGVSTVGFSDVWALFCSGIVDVNLKDGGFRSFLTWGT